MPGDYNLEKELKNCEHKKEDSHEYTKESVVLCTSSDYCAYSGRAELWKGRFRKTCNYDTEQDI